MKRLLIIIGAVVLVVIVSTWFFFSTRSSNLPGDTSGGTSEQQVTKVVLTEVSHPLAITRLLIHLMRKQGLDEKYGLEIEEKSVPALQGYQALLSGAVDVAQFDAPSVARVNAESDRKIRIFAKAFDADTYLVTTLDSEIASLDDLKGKTIGSVVHTSTTYGMMLLLLHELGYDLETDFQVVTAPPLSLISLLEKGEVDAIVTIEPLYSQLLTQGKIKPLLSFADVWKETVGMGVPFTGLAASEEWLEENREGALAFTKAWYDASRYFLNNLEILDDPELQEFLEAEDPKMVEQLKTAYPRLLPSALNKQDVEDTKAYIMKLREVGFLPENASAVIFIQLEN